MTLLIIILIALALILVAAELFVVGGVLGTLGALLLLVASGLSFYHFGIETGLVVLFASSGLAIAIVVIGFRFLQRSPMGHHMFLGDATSRQEGFASADPSLDRYRGKSGVSVSQLRPSGLADFDGERITVATQGEFLDKGVPVEVIDIQYNQVIVRQKAS